MILKDKVVIVSSDKDLMQLVTEKVVMLDTMKDRWLDEEAVYEKFGVKPSQVTQVQALMGDSSDNIPGLAGVGPKTASKLIARFGSVEGLLEHHLEVEGKIGEKLPEQVEELKTSLSLVTLKDDVPVEPSLEDLVLSDFRTWQFQRFV